MQTSVPSKMYCEHAVSIKFMETGQKLACTQW